MADAVVAVHDLEKRFGEVRAVDAFSFSVNAGEACGLLGPNGAGKTTTLRVLLGLERATSGRAELFGEAVRPGSHQLARVGALVEEAAFVPHLSGITNLKLWWGARGASWSEADVDGALSVAALGDAINRKVRTYSQGMKQRLGFARLLLGRPELLVLDEPTNGLDPGEIREIRGLIARLTGEGATVLLSSHHLAEVEQICGTVIVMNRGQLVASGRVSDIIGSDRSVYVEVDDRDRAQNVLAGLAFVERITAQGDGLLVALRAGQRSDIATALVGAGVRLETLMATQRLEDAFLELLDELPPPPSGAVGTYTPAHVPGAPQ